MSSEKQNTKIKDESSISNCWSVGILGAAATATLCRPVALVFLSALLIAGSQRAGAQTEIVLYSFTGATDGANPVAGLVQDRRGNLYGTAEFGGTSGSCFGYGCGTVFRITAAGSFNVLYTFSGGTDGGIPVGGLIQDQKGNLYGTTSNGTSFYDGTVFEIARDGTERILHSFTGSPDGANPVAGLVRDAHGHLYGTTFSGGTFGSGTVFRLTPSGKETILHSFAGVPDGWFPYGGLTRDPHGNLYGTTYQGGAYGLGSIFEVRPSGLETLLYSFRGTIDGAFPVCGLMRDVKGNLYGTTIYTGDFSGFGTVFKLTPGGTKTVLHTFGGGDGAYPQGVLVRDEEGNFYGTTPQGGAFGNGTVFELAPTGTVTVLYSFTGGADGSYPRGGVLRDEHGNLYGTTQYGGAFNFGTVFKLTP